MYTHPAPRSGGPQGQGGGKFGRKYFLRNVSSSIQGEKPTSHGSTPYPRFGKDESLTNINGLAIYCGTAELVPICRGIRNSWRKQETQLARLLSFDLLQYVSVCAANYRLSSISSLFCKVPKDLHQISKLVSGLRLPDQVCCFIEQIGITQLNGITIYPGFAETAKELHAVLGLFSKLPDHMEDLYDSNYPETYYVDHRLRRDSIISDYQIGMENVTYEDQLSSQCESHVETSWEIDPRILSYYMNDLKIEFDRLGFRTVNYGNLQAGERFLLSLLNPEICETIQIYDNEELSPSSEVKYIFRSLSPRDWYPYPGNYQVLQLAREAASKTKDTEKGPSEEKSPRTKDLGLYVWKLNRSS